MARHRLFLQLTFCGPFVWMCFKSCVLLSRLWREATKWFLCANDGRAACGATATNQLRHYSHSLIGWKGYRIQAFRSVENVTRGELPQSAHNELKERKLFQTQRNRMTDDDRDGIFGGDLGFDSDAEKEKEEEREKRTRQTEQDFQRQKSEWTPKVETREVPQTHFWRLNIGIIESCLSHFSAKDEIRCPDSEIRCRIALLFT